MSGDFCDFLSKIDHFRGGPECLSLAVTEKGPLPVWGHFPGFVVKNQQKPATLLFVLGLYHSPLPRYDHIWSGIIFDMFHRNSSKIDHFRDGPKCMSLAVSEIRPLPVLGDFSDFYSIIILSRPF